MDVCCPQCETVYEVEELSAYSPAVSLQCSQCDFVFRLNASGQTIQENQRRWMIRTRVSGDILYFNTFDVLHRWIMDGTVTGDDAISRTGERWMELKHIGEFAPIFQTVESIAKITDTRSGGGGAMAAPTPRASSKPRPRPVALSATQDVVTQVIPAPQPPAQQRARPRSQTLPYGLAATPRKPITAEIRSPITASPAPVIQSRVEPEPVQARRAQHLTSPGRPTGDFTEPAVKVDDAWSFGDSIPEREHREDANSEPTRTWGGYDVNAASRLANRSKRRRHIILGLTVSVVLSCGVAGYFYQEPLQDWWNTAFAPGDVIKLGDSAGERSSERADKASAQAVGSADASAVDQVTYETSSNHVFDALVLAEKQQKRHYKDVQARASKSIKPVKRKASIDEEAVQPGDTNSLSAVLSSAKSALERGNTKRARQMYHKAVGLDPQNAEAISGLGWSLLALGNPDSARAQFLRAKYRDPDFDGSYIGLGRAERELGNFEEALKAYEDYIKRFPNGSQVTIARYQSQELKRQLGE